MGYFLWSNNKNMKKIKDGLTFDDVLMVPRKSGVYSRNDVSTKTQLTKNISLNVPIVSANMDTVTEARMARCMAEAGGIGIIHRFLSIETQADEVRKVKRAENVIIDDPYTITPKESLETAENFMINHNISGLPVLEEAKKVVGIITRKDILFSKNKNILVRDAMTKKVITASPKISVTNAKELLFKYRIEKLPLIDAKGCLKGLITLKDMLLSKT